MKYLLHPLQRINFLTLNQVHVPVFQLIHNLIQISKGSIRSGLIFNFRYSLFLLSRVDQFFCCDRVVCPHFLCWIIRLSCSTCQRRINEAKLHSGQGHFFKSEISIFKKQKILIRGRSLPTLTRRGGQEVLEMSMVPITQDVVAAS